jgi:predicted nicotinamide N-methyase
VSETANNKLDTTGFLMWPSEEILTIYMLNFFNELLKNSIQINSICKNKVLRILEIGAGYSGVCAIALAHWFKQKAQEFPEIEKIEICITDGVKPCVDKIKECIELNPVSSDIVVEAKVFNWKDYESFESQNGKFDLIFGADVLFFRNYHTDLANSLSLLLNPESAARTILMAPDRDGTLTQFQNIV